jgi:hypothetical protein
METIQEGEGMGLNSVDVELIKEQLREVEPGGDITFSSLSALTGKDLQGPFYHLLRRALLELEEEGYQFENVRNIGYRRMTDEERMCSVRTIKSIKTKSQRGITQKTAGIDFDAMPSSAKVTQQVHLYILATTKSMTTRKAFKKIERLLKDSNERLTGIEDQLKMFGK